jgi:hypothetical protein
MVNVDAYETLLEGTARVVQQLQDTLRKNRLKYAEILPANCGFRSKKGGVTHTLSGIAVSSLLSACPPAAHFSAKPSLTFRSNVLLLTPFARQIETRRLSAVV